MFDTDGTLKESDLIRFFRKGFCYLFLVLDLKIQFSNLSSEFLALISRVCSRSDSGFQILGLGSGFEFGIQDLGFKIYNSLILIYQQNTYYHTNLFYFNNGKKPIVKALPIFFKAGGLAKCLCKKSLCFFEKYQNPQFLSSEYKTRRFKPDKCLSRSSLN